MNELKVALLQMNIDDVEPETNVRRAVAAMRGASERPDVFVLPELWTRTYVPGMTSMPHEASPDALEAVSAACRELGAHAVVGSMPWLTERGVVNRTWIVDDAGTPFASYDKAHLFSYGGEDGIFAPGEAPCIFNIGEVPCAVMMCYEIRFAEYARALSLGGAEVLFVVAQWPKRRGSAWEVVNRAMAANSQIYVVSCNNTGTSSEQDFLGHSMVVSPWGDVIAGMTEAEGVLPATLELHQVEKCRRHIPILKDRRPDLYHILLN